LRWRRSEKTIHSISRTPIQTFLRFFALEFEGEIGTLDDASDSARHQSALSRLPTTTLDALIGEAKAALAKSGEGAIRAMFQDGHFHFDWHTPDAATKFLEIVLADALRKRTR
jgi:hypothetical protein